MNIFLTEDEETEIPVLQKSEDGGIIITPGLKTRERISRTDLEKEIIGIDTIDNGAKMVGPIHNISTSHAGDYAAGNRMNEDSRARVLSHKHDIQDVAITKLMETLNMLDPNNMEKDRDKISLMTGLSGLLDKMSDKSPEGTKVVHLHLYGPKQKKETDYEVIDV